MRGRRHGESLFHWIIVPRLPFRQVTQDVKLTNLQNLLPRRENRFKGQDLTPVVVNNSGWNLDFTSPREAAETALPHLTKGRR
jgi:hypothetical protein